MLFIRRDSQQLDEVEFEEEMAAATSAAPGFFTLICASVVSSQPSDKSADCELVKEAVVVPGGITAAKEESANGEEGLRRSNT